MTERPSNDSLLTQSLELTISGIILTLVMSAVYQRITGEGVVVICCFLAAHFVWKMIFPVRRYGRYFLAQVASVVMAGLFSWWLIYTAENTRTGWYRFNVLQKRITNFVHHAPAYIIMANAEGYITDVSDNIELLTGYTPKELAGQPVTILMRDAPAAKHLIAFDKAIRVLRDASSPDSGWTLQGSLTVGVKHKDGHIIPVRIYAGGIRWSADIQFNNDIDVFAVFIPVSVVDAAREIKVNDGTTLPEGTDIKGAPPPPPVRPLAPLPSPKPLPPIQNDPIYREPND